MKTQHRLFNLLIVLLFICTSCSKDDLLIDPCFVVKDKDTNLPIEYVRVYLLGKSNPGIPYLIQGKRNILEVFSTNVNGEVCFDISKQRSKEIVQIWCHKIGYEQLFIENPPSSLYEIYMEKE